MKKFILCLILLNTSCFAILDSKKISLNEAINIALKTNPQVKIAKLSIDSAQNDIKVANKLQNPSVGIFQNFGRVGKSEPQQLGADYTIELLKRRARKNVAKAEFDSAINNQKVYENNLVFEVKKAYIELLLKKSNLKIIKEQSDLSKEMLDSMTNAPKTDIIQAKIAYNRSIIYKNIANSEVVSAQNRFNTIMNSNNLDYDTKEDSLSDNYSQLLTLNPHDDTLTYENIKNYALNNRYDLAMAKNEVEIAAKKLQMVKSQLIPDLELSSGYAYQTRGYSEEGYYQAGAYLGASLVNIPVIYRYQPEIKNAKLEIEKAQLKYEDTKIDALRNITDAWEKYTIAKNNLNFYNKELLSNSKELLSASKQSLNQKQIDITAFIVSKKLYLELILGYQEALAEYYISYAELLKEMNVIQGVETL